MRTSAVCSVLNFWPRKWGLDHPQRRPPGSKASPPALLRHAPPRLSHGPLPVAWLVSHGLTVHPDSALPPPVAASRPQDPPPLTVKVEKKTRPVTSRAMAARNGSWQVHPQVRGLRTICSANPPSLTKMKTFGATGWRASNF